jgi:hypothetical protein
MPREFSRGALWIRAGAVGGSRLLGGGLTYPVKVPVAEESDKNNDHERREKDLTPRDNEGRWEQQ